MIQFESEFEMPPYEEKHLDHYKKNAAADLGIKLLEVFDYEKQSGKHITMKEFEDSIMSRYPIPEVGMVKYSMGFYAAKIQDYHELKSNILTIFTIASGANMETQKLLHTAFSEFESKDLMEPVTGELINH